ncbi:MAG: electron transfer flavoprotein subunit alpha/FixB family protein [Chloroflexi bacterium]|nr:electron transfer flavoprotein subunit alpha/FixB family protein [Chloroflexota bacterium]
MREILVLAEHRRGEMRDITLEMLGKGRQLADKCGAELAAVLLGKGVGNLASALSQRANRVLVVEDAQLENFNSEAYQQVLAGLITERKPILTLVGHTSSGLDLAPSLAVQLDLPLATDCIDVDWAGGRVVATRTMYGGKVRSTVALAESPGYLVTIQAGNFAPAESRGTGEIVDITSPLAGEIAAKRFIEYIESAAGDVDIGQSDIVVSVGRGIGDPKNLPLVEELATKLGGVLACSRPVVDKKWLPKSRQVGISGKTVNPKLYLAVGISGAFQHVTAIRGAGMVVAINKDPKAPIFRVADYGIVGDLFAVVPALNKRIAQAKAEK